MTGKMNYLLVVIGLFTLSIVVLGVEGQNGAQPAQPAQQVQQSQSCTPSAKDIPSGWVDIQTKCVDAVREQIQKEVNASFAYLAMGAYFSRDTVNRPGFAEHFLSSAKEEREHAITLIHYLTMRGKLNDHVTGLITFPASENIKHEWIDGVDALTDALKLEVEVTEFIRNVIRKCEKGAYNDYHIVDYLTGVYLEEQYKAERELAGKISTLKKMQDQHGELGEFLFDKTLLE